MRTHRSALATLLLVASTANGQSADTFVPVTDAMLQNPDPADWLMWRRTLDLWGYSPLAAIDRSNVDELRSEEHTSELQSQSNLVCRLLLEKKKRTRQPGVRVDARGRPPLR